MSSTTLMREGSRQARPAPSKQEPERIDRSSAIEWAKANGIKPTPVETFHARLNAKRAQLRLPRFIIDARSQIKLVVDRPAPPPAAPLAQTEDHLLELVSAHHGTITALVTPEIASWLIELNTGNRPVLKSNLERFRAILHAGAWQNTGEPVIVSRDGILNDGQHRLIAIRDTKIPVVLDVRFGVAREAFYATGFGKRRSTAHVLGVEGYSNTTCQAGIARLLRAYDLKQMGTVRQNPIEPGDALKIVEENEHIGHVAARIQRLAFPPCRCAGFGFPLVLAARKLPLDRVFEFAGLVASGLADKEGLPTYRLHHKLSEMRGRRERIPQVDLAALTVKAWNAWLAREALPVMRLVDADRSCKGFPQLRWT